MNPDAIAGSPAFKAAVFDFDGVLVDTIPLHHRSFQELFAAEGVAFSFADYQRVANGAPRDRVIRSVLGSDIAPERFDRLMRRKEEIILELARREGLRAIDGALDVVRSLVDLGLRVGIASSSRTAAVFLDLLGARSLFHSVTDGSETHRAKPDPEVFLTAARKLDVNPQQCLAFEDAPVGVAAAHAAGMRVVGLTTTTTAADLRQADWIIDSFRGLDLRPILFPDRSRASCR